MLKMVPIRCATTLPSACKETRLSCTWLFQGTNRGRNHTTFKGVHLNFARSLGFTNREEQLMLWYLNSSSLYRPSVLDGARANTAWRRPISRVLRENSILHVNSDSTPVFSATDVREPPGRNMVEFIQECSKRMAWRSYTWTFLTVQAVKLKIVMACVRIKHEGIEFSEAALA